MSRHPPAMKPRAILRALNKAGFFVHHVSGSHYILKRPEQPTLRVTLPWHGKDVKRGTLLSIVEQAGLTLEEFLELL